jgi:hypothetical protein
VLAAAGLDAVYDEDTDTYEIEMTNDPAPNLYISGMWRKFVKEKKGDKQAAAFIRRYGDISCELDAIALEFESALDRGDVDRAAQGDEVRERVAH